MKLPKIIAILFVCTFNNSCTTIQADNAKINQLHNHRIKRGDSKEAVIAKVGKPAMKRSDGNDETWTYVRSNEQNLASPYLFIPIVGMFASMNAIDKEGGYQQIILMVVFNSRGYVKTVNVNKTQANMLRH